MICECGKTPMLQKVFTGSKPDMVYMCPCGERVVSGSSKYEAKLLWTRRREIKEAIEHMKQRKSKPITVEYLEEIRKIPAVVFSKRIWLDARRLNLCSFTDEELELACSGNGIIKTGNVYGAGTVMMAVDSRLQQNPDK